MFCDVFLKMDKNWTKRWRRRLCRPGEIALSTWCTHVQPGGHCIIDMAGMFVRVSCPTETQTDRPRQTDRDRRTKTDRPRQTDGDRPTETDRPKTDRPRQTNESVSCSTQPDRLTDRDRHTETEPSVKGLMIKSGCSERFLHA